MSTPITTAQWRQLYRELLRAAPRTVSNHRPTSRILATKIRQGFTENTSTDNTHSDLALLYTRGYNTLAFLKLARELGSVERKLVTSIVQVYKDRKAADEKPPIHKKKWQKHQKQVYDETFGEYDRVLESIERDLEIILPRDRFVRSLEWIPKLDNLHKGDPLVENASTVEK
ncbi:hypothetical protein DL89DRAFT_291848 [Linderina pennispora]|uniref:Complex 1 LYR protein domain-containing protein n=1 Tax=Linderina pennispora TaxID=61395 RepID=A0A1Y1WD65_9FUNG|nr:uncharacterized protein DL89DRAFT_291848 [Linderina pennispora]KAJ1955306.1 hypothetical protein EC988_001956 [Linderina pennispora]ORX71325.1 hypothetical protein DL89DRAFT_291848 [Linderina pennispora]